MVSPSPQRPKCLVRLMVCNDIGVCPAKHQIVIGDTEIINYGSSSRHTRQPTVQCTQSFLLHNPNRTVVLPGEYVQFSTPSDSDSDTWWALEARLDCPSNMTRKPEDAWPPPQQIFSVDHAVCVSNTTELEEIAPLRSSTIGAEFLPYSKRTIFACPPSKLSSAPERPPYWAGCGLMAPCKLAPASWPHYPRSSLLQQCKACALFKVLSRVLPRFADLLDALDQATAGKESREKIAWSDELLLTFKTAQHALENHQTITVTDGSVKNRDIAATRYVHHSGQLLLAGFFSAKLHRHQVTWLPCEIEALGIGAAIKHFAPYIIQSPHTNEVLTDSRPCVQAYEKLKRGEFSTSSGHHLPTIPTNSQPLFCPVTSYRRC